MTGRHRGSHRDEEGERRRKVAQVSTLLLLAVVGFAVIRALGTDSSCDGEVKLRVAASPDLAPAVEATVAAWTLDQLPPPGRCSVAVSVTPAASAQVAGAIAGSAGRTLRGATASTAAVPQVWIPDSSTWLQRLRGAGVDLGSAAAVSVANSPVVLGVPEPVARALGWPDATPSWTGLLTKMTDGSGLRVGIVDPASDSAGLSGLLALGAAAKTTGAAAQETTVAAMRALVNGRTNARAELLAAFPKSADAQAVAAGLGAAPLSEQALMAYNSDSPAVRLAALYPTPAPPPLDYPFVVLPTADGEQSALAERLRTALAGEAYQSRLTAAGLRSADGSAGFRSPPGAPTKATATRLEADAVSTAVATWISVTLPARMLAVIDVSGSMLTPVPTAGGASRGQISVAAAKQGLMLFDDTWSVGLWTFSTKLDGDKDYAQLVPIGPMSTQRAALAKALLTVAPKEGGETGLYDTVLAAYQAVQQGWDRNAVNSVVIMTDGFNRDENGLTLPQLLAELKKVVDPARPIQVIAIGIGDTVSEAELKQIVAATGGGVFIARDPSAIGEIFLKAIALRPAATY